MVCNYHGDAVLLKYNVNLNYFGISQNKDLSANLANTNLVDLKINVFYKFFSERLM